MPLWEPMSQNRDMGHPQPEQGLCWRRVYTHPPRQVKVTMPNARTVTMLSAVLLLSSYAASAQDSWAWPCFQPLSITQINLSIPSQGPPFSAVMKTKFDHKLADGNSIHPTSEAQIARNSAGKILHETL
jgi:hypothetical protein